MFESAADFRDHMEAHHPHLVKTTCDSGVHLKWSDRSVEVWDVDGNILADLKLVENHQISLKSIEIKQGVDDESVETDNTVIEFTTVTDRKITTSFA